MHVSVRLALLAIASTLPLAAQSACNNAALEDAARTVADLRHSLHEQSVAERDPLVPAAVAGQLSQLKDALTLAADAAFACAPASTDADQLQTTLADALHANRVPAAEATFETKNKRDIGAYGSDLSVQIFQLFSKPKFLEVDFRYGVECGDDNLLLIYEADSGHPGWQQSLRWDAPTYHTVADALGDFVLLTPLTGDYRHPTWRFVVAHGHPGCARSPRPTRFDIDLLAPTADPAKPTVTWHFDHPYTETKTTVPRLSTTDDTVDFRIQSADPQSVRAKTGSPKGEAIYRFRLTGNGQMEPLPADASSDATPSATDGTQAGKPPAPSTSSSPQ